MRYWRWAIRASILAVFAAGAAARAQPAPTPQQSAVLAAGLPIRDEVAPGQAQPVPQSENVFLRFFRDGEWYASWGYSKQYWAPTDIHVSQPSLGNNFTLHDVHGADG